MDRPKVLKSDLLRLGCNPEVGDINGDGIKEVLLNTRQNLYSWDPWSKLVDSTYKKPYYSGSGGFFIVLNDFNGDGLEERAFTVDGREVYVIDKNGKIIFRQTGYFSHYSLNTGDFNGDGKPDIATFNLYIYNKDGTSAYDSMRVNIPGTPYRLNYTDVIVTLGDVDGDGKNEIILKGTRILTVINLDGKVYNYSTSTPPEEDPFPFSGTSALIGDIDGDAEPEIIFYGRTKLHAYKNTGEEVKGFPMEYSIFESTLGRDEPVFFLGDYPTDNNFIDSGLWLNSPILTDLEGDGKLEIIAVGIIPNDNSRTMGIGDYPVVYVIDTNAWYDPENIEWAQYGANNKHNFRHGEEKGKYWYQLPNASWAKLDKEKIKFKCEFYRDGAFDTALPILDKIKVAYTTGRKGVNPKLVELSDGTMVIAYEEKEGEIKVAKYVAPGIGQTPLDIAFNSSNITPIAFKPEWIDGTLNGIWAEKDDSGYTVYRGEMEKFGADSILLYGDTTTVSLNAGDSITLIKKLDKKLSDGNYVMESELISKKGQILAQSTKDIIVSSDSGISISFKKDDRNYKVGDTVNITAIVTNNSLNSLYNGEVKIIKVTGQNTEGVDLFTKNITLNPCEFYECNTSTVANEKFQLIAKANPEAIENIEVFQPEIQAYPEIPEVMDERSFPASLRLYNPTKLELDVRVSVSVNSVSVSDINNQDIIIKPLGWEVINLAELITAEKEMSIKEDTKIFIKITGRDIPEQIIEKNIEFGSRMDIKISPDIKYPAGKISIPYTLRNIGKLDCDGEVKIEVRSQAIEVETQNFASLQNSEVRSENIEKVYIEKNQSKDMQFVADLQEEGLYRLKIKYKLDSTEVEFNCIPEERVEIEKVNIGKSIEGIIPINFQVRNTGYKSIGGNVEITTGFSNENRRIDLDSEKDDWYSFQINSGMVPGGKYPLKINIESGSGTVKIYETSIIISESKFTVEQINLDNEFLAGNPWFMDIKIKNIGDRGGKASIDYRIGEFYNKSKDYWLVSGESIDETLNFIIPDDMAYGKYNVEIKVNGKKEPILIPIIIRGIELEVKAKLDKEGYRAGDNLKLNLTIKNLSDKIDASLYARIKYDSGEINEEFTIWKQETQNKEFNLTLNRITGAKLFIGIYESNTRRSIYLNELYVKPGNKIKIYRNGKLIGIVYADTSGNFQYNVELVEGENNITAIAFNNAGESGLIANIQKIELDTISPSPITNLYGEARNKLCILYWSKNGDDTRGYNIYRRQNSELRMQKINTEIVTATYYNDLNVENNNTYIYIVTGVDKAGNESLYSNEVSLSPNGDINVTINKRINAENKNILVYVSKSKNNRLANQGIGFFDSSMILENLNTIKAPYLKYYITCCREEYIEKLRTGEYNIFILNDIENEEEFNARCEICGRIISNLEWNRSIQELSEAVYRGMGLIFIKGLPSVYYPYPFDNMIGANPIEPDLKEYPCIVSNNYGKGKLASLTFQPIGKEVNDKRNMQELIEYLISYIEPNFIQIKPYSTIPIITTIKTDNIGNLAIREELTKGLKIKNTNGTITSDEKIKWDMDIKDVLETKTLLLNIQVPDRMGTYQAKTISQYKYDNNQNQKKIKEKFTSTAIDLEIKQTLKEKLKEQVRKIKKLQIKIKIKDELIDKLTRVQAVSKKSYKEIIKAIDLILSSISLLNKLEKEASGSNLKNIKDGFINKIQNIHLSLNDILLGFEVIWEEKYNNFEPDVIPSEILFTIPANGASNININTIISVQFSEDMDSVSISETSFQVEQAEGLRLKVEGKVTYNNRIATFIPMSPLELNTVYIVTITDEVRDLAGNEIERNYTWEFATIDTIAPQVRSTLPEAEAKNVKINTSISVQFSEEMDSASVNENTVTVTSSQSPVFLE